jgi:hypothetical protein
MSHNQMLPLPTPTPGEWLADIARQVSTPRITIAEAGDDMATGLAVVKLALVLKGRPVVLFRSIVEEWDLPTIVRELY